jgi:predicted negative regulator of RcsB-dependent stress response
MKKKEKEHLKADPFVHFVEQAIAFLKNNLRPLLTGVAAVILIVLILLAIFLFRNLSSSGENKLYAEAFRVSHDAKMTVEQKIARLQDMKFRNGISASGRLFLAALLYEKGDLAKAESVLLAMPKSRVALLNDEKHLLYAQVLAANGKGSEAEAVLNRLLSEKKTVMAREIILLQLAKMQIKGQRSAEAAVLLKRILSEHGNTPGAMEAQNLLATIEAAGSASR